MSITAMPGAARQRFLQVGFQSALLTAVPPTRRVPWRGMIGYNPNLTQPDVDEGSIDPIQLPYPTVADVALPATGLVAFNDLPIRRAAGLMGGVTPTVVSGVATWVYQVNSLTQDPFDVATIESGDDTEATNTTQGIGGVIDSWEDTYPEDGGPLQISDNWIFAKGLLGQNGQDGLLVDPSPVFAFGTDSFVTHDAAAGSIGMTAVSDALHSLVVRGNNNLDKKRFQNGSNTRFQIAGFARGQRTIEVVETVAETAAVIALIAAFDNGVAVTRYIKISTNSTEIISGSTTYTLERWIPARLFEIGDAEVGSNAAKTLTWRAFRDPTLGYAYKERIVCGLTALP